MIFLPDTNACITLLRQRNMPLMARWRRAAMPCTLRSGEAGTATQKR